MSLAIKFTRENKDYKSKPFVPIVALQTLAAVAKLFFLPSVIMGEKLPWFLLNIGTFNLVLHCKISETGPAQMTGLT